MEWKYLGSHKEDIVLDVVDASGDDGQRHAGENVSIITLTRIECLTIVSYWQERRTTSKNSFSLKESINQFKMWFDFFQKSETISLRQYICKRLRQCTRLC